tara:strand:- start:420 stop:1325 length:906 start_codon:yes stop_codon:yes gene_type:complete
MNKKIIMPIALITLLSLAVFVSATMTSKNANGNYNIQFNKGWNLVSTNANEMAEGQTFELSSPNFEKTLTLNGESHTFKITKFAESGEPYLSIDGSEGKTNYYLEEEKLQEETGVRILGSSVIEDKKRISYTLSNPNSCQYDDLIFYMYNPLTGKYFNDEDSFDSLMQNEGLNDYRFANEGGSMWVYAKKNCEMTIDSYDIDKAQNYNRLLKGWNFLAVTPDLTNPEEYAGNDIEIKDFSGNCNIEKSYLFDSQKQEWVSFPITEEFYEDIIGLGWLVKVSEDCKFGTPTGEVEGPPTIPN